MTSNQSQPELDSKRLGEAPAQADYDLAYKIVEQMGLGFEFRHCSCGQLPCARLRPIAEALAKRESEVRAELFQQPRETARVAEIRKRVAERDDGTAMESACGEYNCSCHDDVPYLLSLVRQPADNAVEARANAIRDAISEVTRELTYSDDVIGDERVPFDDLSMCRRAVFALQSLLDKKEVG